MAVPHDILDVQKMPTSRSINWVSRMLQVLAMAAPYGADERDKLVGLMLDEAKVVG